MKGPDEPPRTVLFVDHSSIVGGAQLSLAEHLRALDRQRYAPHVACTGALPALLRIYAEAGAEVHVVPLPRLRRLHPVVLAQLFTSARALRRLVRALRPDLVVAGTSRASYITAIALLGSGVPLVWWVRDFQFNRLVFRVLAPLVTRFFCVSEGIRDFYGGRRDSRFRVVVVGSTLHRELAHLDDARVVSERSRWGFQPTDVVVGFMGRLVEEKGAEDLVEAVASLHEHDPRLKLLIVGTGKGQHRDVEARLKTTVARRGWSFVSFAGFQADQALFYRLFDVAVIPSRTAEGYPMSAVQAMMAGTPVVASAVGGTVELVRDHVTGLLVPPSSPRDLANAIAELLADPRLRGNLAAAAHAQVMASNREEVTTRRAEQLYDEIVSDTTSAVGAVRSVPA